jgi:flavin-binding protein dodecin
MPGKLRKGRIGNGPRYLDKGDHTMARVVKVIELMAQSPKSWEEAAQSAVTEASKTLRNIRSIYIKEFLAAVDDGKVSSYRITAKVTFDLDRGEG